MSDVTNELSRILQSNGGAPFLFVGSGFSRRYLGSDDWKGLLRRFCAEIREFDYYFASTDGDLPMTASLIARDFHDLWWNSAKYEESREKFRETSTSVQSALKNEIAQFLSQLPLEGLPDEQIQREISALKNLNVDGIITTNWDLLLEELFPGYRVFIGQEELLFSNPQAIAEIYKIHGCASRPKSLILTSEDYHDFHEKNPYLAAKLITLFIEHPIIFIGYAVQDPHIQRIIFSIASCLANDKLEKFCENLVFVRRSHGRSSSIQKITFSHAGRSVTATVLEVDDFCEVYAAIDAGKRKIPARILRYCKEQMYELVKSAEPEKKIAVVDIDELDASEQVEFVVGIGLAKNHRQQQSEIASEGQSNLARSGYRGVSIADLFDDLPRERSTFDADELLRVAFPSFARSNATYIPVFRYLRAAGVDDSEKLVCSEYKDAARVIEKIKKRGYRVRGYRSQYNSNWSDKTTTDILSGLDPERVTLILPFQSPMKVEREPLRKFLLENSGSSFRDPYRSYYKKLACYYDYLAFGFEL
ncbi:SIR2 family protein [Rhodoligotrophos ferricapiens]|uniref:SIR2 family protein n=1 Tax=Rhodoligotrophos ferricapiens TaxID=3069264 RepID=UPI00315C5B75